MMTLFRFNLTIVIVYMILFDQIKGEVLKKCDSDVRVKKIFDNVAPQLTGDQYVTEVYDNGDMSTICWAEITIIKENSDNQVVQAMREYAISFKSPSGYPDDSERGELERKFEIFDLDTKKSRVLNFKTVSTENGITTSQHRAVTCGSGPKLTKTYLKSDSKKMIEIKVMPKDMKVEPSLIRRVLPSSDWVQLETSLPSTQSFQATTSPVLYQKKLTESSMDPLLSTDGVPLELPHERLQPLNEMEKDRDEKSVKDVPDVRIFKSATPSSLAVEDKEAEQSFNEKTVEKGLDEPLYRSLKKETEEMSEETTEKEDPNEQIYENITSFNVEPETKNREKILEAKSVKEKTDKRFDKLNKPISKETEDKRKEITEEISNVLDKRFFTEPEKVSEEKARKGAELSTVENRLNHIDKKVTTTQKVDFPNLYPDNKTSSSKETPSVELFASTEILKDEEMPSTWTLLNKYQTDTPPILSTIQPNQKVTNYEGILQSKTLVIEDFKMSTLNPVESKTEKLTEAQLEVRKQAPEECPADEVIRVNVKVMITKISEQEEPVKTIENSKEFHVGLVQLKEDLDEEQLDADWNELIEHVMKNYLETSPNKCVEQATLRMFPFNKEKLFRYKARNYNLKPMGKIEMVEEVPVARSFAGLQHNSAQDTTKIFRKFGILFNKLLEKMM